MSGTLAQLAGTPTASASQGAADGANGEGAMGPVVQTKLAQRKMRQAIAVQRIRQRAGMAGPNPLTPSGSGNPYDQAYAKLAPSLQVGGGS